LVKLNKMKVLLYSMLLLSLIGCSTNDTKSVDSVDVIDTILLKSQSNLDTAAYVNHKSDSVTKETVVKVVKQIKVLTKEVETYKKINLLMSQTVTTEKVIYKIDTVYIETKRNFWGKEKTNTSIKSDSLINQKIDTSINNSIKVDTTLQIVNI
jgi:hypothetical protein